jgi:hypothetical protein
MIHSTSSTGAAKEFCNMTIPPFGPVLLASLVALAATSDAFADAKKTDPKKVVSPTTVKSTPKNGLGKAGISLNFQEVEVPYKTQRTDPKRK